jgi:hypothetical protein
MARLTTSKRGYGWAHQQARKRALAAMPDGAPCTRCGGPMWRSQGKLLDLDHTDDRTGYRGLAHRACNRRAGQAKGVRRRTWSAAHLPPAPQPQHQPTPRSRDW